MERENSQNPTGMNRLKVEAKASLGELNDFLKRMKGKSPYEMLGIAAQSGLFVAVLQATIVTVVLMFAWTGIDFFRSQYRESATSAENDTNNKKKSEEAKPAEKPVAKSDETKAEAKKEPSKEKPAEPTKPTEGKQPLTPSKGTETKTGTPKGDPLDDLLNKSIDK